MTRDVLMSIRPRFAEAIFAGEKTHELRRQFPASLSGATVYVYASTPLRKVIGSFQIASVQRIPKWLLARTRRRATTLTATELLAYLDGLHHGVLLEVSNPTEYARPVPLARLRAIGIEPPQSYRFLRPDVAAQLCAHPNSVEPLASLSVARCRGLTGSTETQRQTSALPPDWRIADAG